MSERGGAAARSPVVRRLVVGVLVLLAVAGAFLGGAALAPPVPTDDGPDAGFARDMAAHHEQAVEMAEIVRDRTDDERIRVVAADVALTQTAQIGMMQGWLALWDLPLAGAGPRMAWMAAEAGHGAIHAVRGGAMPGVASAADLDRLRTLPAADADRLFLRLMIEHHRGGVEMAGAGRRLAATSEVRGFADRVATSQTAEIGQMEDLLQQLSIEPDAGSTAS